MPMVGDQSKMELHKTNVDLRARIYLVLPQSLPNLSPFVQFGNWPHGVVVDRILMHSRWDLNLSSNLM